MTGNADHLLFGVAVEPLPFVDPTAAAQRLGLQRHSLACYRSLDIGPAWYKFGRWVRYLPEDLDLWLSGHAEVPRIGRFKAVSGDDPYPDRALIDTPAAARFLTVTPHCLANYRLEGVGPMLRRMGRRHYYMVGDLINWVEAQRRDGRALTS